MVPARNLMAEELQKPFSSFFKKARFEHSRESLTTNPILLANKADDETKDTEEKLEVGRNPNNPENWLQLGVASTHEIAKAEPIELELFTDNLSGQMDKQMASSFKTQRNAFLGPYLRSSCGPLIGGCDFTVISTPRRPEAGMWLVLSAAQYQLKEPLLPQTERNYLRIKDCNMTVRLLMKYLAGKLGLTNESEVEICCKGQSLPPFLMLQYVRDHIWSSKDATVLHTCVDVTDHVMTLTYGRRRSSE